MVARRLAIVDGRIRPERGASVSIDNPSFLSGYGLFETLLVRSGRAVFWKEHLARLGNGARRLGIEWPPGIDRLAERLPELVAANLESEEGALRITLTPAALTADGARGAFWVATLRPIPERSLRKRGGVHGATSRSGAARTLPGFKTTSYVAPHLPLPDGANEWILVNRRGTLLEGGSSNLFLERDGVLETPLLRLGLLPGIVRGWVLGWARGNGIEVVEGRLGAADFFRADGSFATASLTGIAPWLSLDGRPGPGFGPLGCRIASAFEKTLASI
jgi:branched-subunit amino acid aminotransferase/4-amino-4-deoxychorismate lyase